ncbi:CRISPR system Cascade subunit CasC [Aerococcus urinaehominis]|nr:CRISPR system Cascade subunit CasC [Aerococcus urinaehominis]
MKQNKLFIDIHAIQTVPPSNINRDDTGSPKTAQYGGVRRARVSSQSWKRAMRAYFNEYGALDNVGVRSLDIVNYVADKIQSLDPKCEEELALEKAEKVINDAGIKTKDHKARALFFLGDVQAEQLAKAALAGEADKKVLKGYLKDNPAIDIALFGRMVADDPSLNEDASSQVAHAISTHAVQTEFDFYTAVDDLAPEDNAGAGMLGTIEFNSSTLYRYANIAGHELLKQLGHPDVTVKTINLFIKAFFNSMPTGKVNTFANQTLPEAVLVTIRPDRPVNLVTAFEKPVKSRDGHVTESMTRLLEENKQVQKFVEPPLAAYWLTLEDSEIASEGVKTTRDLNDLLTRVGEELETAINETGV